MLSQNIRLTTQVQTQNKPTCFSKLRYFLDERGIRLKWLAKRTGIDYNRLYRLSAGRTEPTVREGYLIKQALICELEQIFDTDVKLPVVEEVGD